MRLRGLAALVAFLLAASGSPASAQRTGDRARLVFTISGAYLQGKGLWGVPKQPLEEFQPADTLVLGRSIRSTLAAGFSAVYWPGAHFGLAADAFLVGLGYADNCRPASPILDSNIGEVCQSIDRTERSAAAVVVAVGGVARVASREFISPFARVSAGFVFSNQSPIRVTGSTNDGTLFIVYDDDKQTRVAPALNLGVGTTIAIAKGYHLRWEVRDNIVGVQAVTGPTVGTTELIPPHKRTYKHLFGLLVGVDVILERQRGRRY